MNYLASSRLREKSRPRSERSSALSEDAPGYESPDRAARGIRRCPARAPLQGFVSRVPNTSLPDDDWLDPIVVRLANKALGDWTDQDAEQLPEQVRQVGALTRPGQPALRQRKTHRAGRETHKPGGRAAAPDGPKLVQTRLVTFTTPEGTEEHTLVHSRTRPERRQRPRWQGHQAG